MKILHVLGDSEFGGGSYVVIWLSKLALKLGWDVDVLTTNKTFQKKLKEENIGIVDLECIWRPIRLFKDWRGMRQLEKFLRNSSYDIVHTHTSKGGFSGRLAARKANIPYIIHTVHGFSFHEHTSNLLIKLYAFLERRAATWCDRLVTVSFFHRDWALKLKIGDKHKDIGIPNGIPDIFPKTQFVNISKMKRDLHISDDQIVLVTQGRLAKQKGIEYLLESLHQIKMSGEERLVLLLAGDGPLRMDLEDLVKSFNLQDSVKFLGFRSDVHNIVYMADIVVLPSLWEGLSIALLEAMSLQKCIITTRIGSNTEVSNCGKFAILVPSCNTFQLKNAIMNLVDRPDKREKMGVNARKVYLKYYTKDLFLSRYQNIYKELVNSQNAKR